MEKKRRIIKLDHQDSKSELQVEGFKEDRISELPDSVLCHIFSFLPTLYVVWTTVLSTRWNNLWISVPSLDFNQTDFPGRRGWLALRTFVDRVLSVRDSSHIDRFHLFCCSFGFEEKDFHLFDPWTFTENRNDVFKLDFCIVADHRLRKLELRLSQRIFIYNTKLVLDLVSKCSITPGCFPSSLKSLSDLMGFLNLNFPSVEEDMVIDGSFKQPFDYYISRKELKTLLTSFIIRDNEEPPTIYLNAPNLENLVIQGPAKDLPNYVLENVSSLVKAEIDLPFADCLSPRGSLLLSRISGVEYLSLSVPCDLVARSIPVFENLKRLKLFHLSSLVWLTEFLRRSPNLEYLVLNTSHPKWRDAEYIPGYLNERYVQGFAPFNPPQTVPNCLLSHLKTISWSAFMGDKEEWEAVKYLFKPGEVLSKFTISAYVQVTKEEAKKLCKEILTFRKCSKTCVVEVI
ncbi:F-box/FBD/LRR-repeat protein At3g26920-like [Rosa rugosa]|uniref:F-box/FBD/LRR-repeat protein At3g26920-like n=1 Tax=Rosa rugosa TaxID=74645 RepID=UPI002B40E6B8|nr:F-box/FBD/LRR-repeat protein At3g26920-like [Rosa rugosa]